MESDNRIDPVWIGINGHPHKGEWIVQVRNMDYRG